MSFLLLGCSQASEEKSGTPELERMSSTADLLPQQAAGLSKAVFASGCFWCTEAVFERVEGVQEVISGYAGGSKANPSYKEVSEGKTDYAEAVIVYYDSTQVNYATLLDIFFHSHDPTQLNRQGPDIGKQYRSGIYYNSSYQKQLAEAYKQQLQKSGEFSKSVVTEIKPLTKFWPAEKYHQDYYRINPKDPYIQAVSKPKVIKFEKEYRQYLKREYQK
ncbi:peptide methionine sulfoxide reductase [Flammeovirgaceae bacterium 311]|nr:peptide methionine sulfoxide reductase [Flammeovirgaceae bacterium 311]